MVQYNCMSSTDSQSHWTNDWSILGIFMKHLRSEVTVPRFDDHICFNSTTNLVYNSDTTLLWLVSEYYIFRDTVGLKSKMVMETPTGI